MIWLLKRRTRVRVLALVALVVVGLWSPALYADSLTVSPIYDFNGVMTVIGNTPNAACGGSLCTETIDLSLEYQYEYLSAGASSNYYVLGVPGTTPAGSETGALGSFSYAPTGFQEAEQSLFYSEVLFPVGSVGSTTEFDLDFDPETNTFSSETFFCTGECNTLFGPYEGIGSVPTTLSYTISEVPVNAPEPGSLGMLGAGLIGIGGLGVRRKLAQQRRPASPFLVNS
jgi:hypothetical protein